MYKLILKEDAKILEKYYKKGHVFEVVGEEGMRCLNIKDQDGVIIYETAMISHLFERVAEDEPTIKVNLWELSTLTDTIEIPDFVKIPEILIINGEYYYRRTEMSGPLRNYVKTTAYEIPEK